MNSKDYRNIREAYLQVYEPQELTEEQVWESVEEWVNALLQEGYDLSDYTWEEMYEGYIAEILGAPNAEKAGAKVRELGGAIVKKGVSNVSNLAKGAADVAGAYGQGFAGQKTTSSNPLAKGYNAASRLMSTPARAVASFGAGVLGLGSKSDGGKVKSTTVPGKSASTDYKSKFAGARDAAIEKAKQIKGSPVLGPKIVGPKIVGPKIVGPGSAGGSSSGSGGSGGSTPKPTATTTPTAPKPAASTTPKFDVDKTGIKPPTTFTKPAAATPEPTPSAEPSGETDRLKKALDIKKSDVTSSFDMFDVVKGYLIGEGYADTEEAALAIMANMSEDWKYSIMEQQISSVSANAPSGVKKPTVTASISAGGKTPPGQKMLDKAGQMLSGKGPSNNFGRGF